MEVRAQLHTSALSPAEVTNIQAPVNHKPGLCVTANRKISVRKKTYFKPHNQPQYQQSCGLWANLVLVLCDWQHLICSEFLHRYHEDGCTTHYKTLKYYVIQKPSKRFKCIKCHCNYIRTDTRPITKLCRHVLLSVGTLHFISLLMKAAT